MLWSYLDDYMCAALTISEALQQYAAFKAVCEELGLVCLPSKFQPPTEEQTILGIVYNSLHKMVALKEGKPQSVYTRLKEFAELEIWSAKAIQEVCGDLIWTSFILPRIRAFVTPIILLLIIALNAPSASVIRANHPQLNAEAISSLDFLLAVLRLDPGCSVYRFLKEDCFCCF